jgi:hypothetical protein
MNTATTRIQLCSKGRDKSVILPGSKGSMLAVRCKYLVQR